MLKEKLRIFKKNQEIIEISRAHFSEKNTIGQIRAFSESLIQITEYDDLGRYKGISVFYIDDITDILWQTARTRAVEKLADIRTPFEIPELNLSSIQALSKNIEELFKRVQLVNEITASTQIYGKIVKTGIDWIHVETKEGQLMLRLDLISRIFIKD